MMVKYGFSLIKSDGGYLIQGTTLAVSKDPSQKKYGMPQEWDVVDLKQPDWPLVTAYGLDSTVCKLSQIRDAMKSI